MLFYPSTFTVFSSSLEMRHVLPENRIIEWLRTAIVRQMMDVGYALPLNERVEHVAVVPRRKIDEFIRRIDILKCRQEWPHARTVQIESDKPAFAVAIVGTCKITDGSRIR